MNTDIKKPILTKILCILTAAVLLTAVIRFFFIFISDVKFLSNISSDTTLEIFILLLIVAACVVALLCLLQHSRKVTQEKIISLAYFDELTGTYNKARFLSLVKHTLLTKSGDFAIVSLDIKNFQAVNELFGFEGGDMLLKFMAESAERAKVDPLEIVCRSTNDEFFLFFRYGTVKRLKERLSLLMEVIGDFAKQRGTQYNITCRCGICLVPPEFKGNIIHLCDRAGAARLKKSNKQYQHSINIYDYETNKSIANRTNIEADMQRAMINGEFKLYLQPQFDLASGELRGGEALVRWEHPLRGLIPPNEFIPLFEENGFVLEIDQYILKSVCETLARWKNAGIEKYTVCVNQSRLHVYQNNYMASLVDVLRLYGANPKNIELELTETIVMDDITGVIDIVNSMHDIGFIVSMDDFGSGYSSLNLLKNVPLDVIKLDKEFFAEGSESERNVIIIRSVINMAKELGILTIAEGIETKDHVNFLKEIGCDVAQGYYYGKPMPLEEFEERFIPSLSNYSNPAPIPV